VLSESSTCLDLLTLWICCTASCSGDVG